MGDRSGRGKGIEDQSCEGDHRADRRIARTANISRLPFVSSRNQSVGRLWSKPFFTAVADRGELNSGSHVVEKNSDLLVARWAASVITRNRSQGREIESRGIPPQYRFFVLLRQIVAPEQLVDLMPALRCIENFVRKVAAEEKGLLSAFCHRGIETVVVAVEADEDASFAELLFELVARLLALLRSADELAV